MRAVWIGWWVHRCTRALGRGEERLKAVGIFREAVSYMFQCGYVKMM